MKEEWKIPWTWLRVKAAGPIWGGTAVKSITWAVPPPDYDFGNPIAFPTLGELLDAQSTEPDEPFIVG